MVRVVRLEDGRLAVGRTLPGRGAWLCRGTPGCVDLAVRRNAFSRALRCTVGGALVEQLRSELGAGPGPARENQGPGSVGTVP
jgi:predicted RNA-binding protein YlxR (DUF448 family)